MTETPAITPYTDERARALTDAELGAVLARLAPNAPERDSRFVNDLVAAQIKWGTFTPKQRPWAERLVVGLSGATTGDPMHGGVRAPAPYPPNPNIASLFERALGSLQHPKIALGPVLLVASKSNGVLTRISVRELVRRRPLAIMERSTGFALKVNYVVSRDEENAVVRLIAAFEANPERVLSTVGRAMGSCALCRRTLTDAESVARGIGPVCIKVWSGGLGWRAEAVATPEAAGEPARA